MVTCSEPWDCWSLARGHRGCPWITATKPTFHLPPFFLSLLLFQGHGLHMDKLSAFLSLSNCCFVVTGTALVSPGMIIEGSLNGLVKARLALSCSVLELGTGKTEQPSPCQIGLGDISPEMAVTKHCTTPLLPLTGFF